MEKSDLPLEVLRLRLELEEGEEPFEIVHKHWGRILWPLVGIGILIALTVIAFLVITFLGGGGMIYLGILIFLGVLYFSVVLYGLSEWYSYRQSALVITNQRVIDSQQVSFLSRRVQAIDLYEIQSCSGELSVGWGTIFDYGELQVHTIGDQPVKVTFVPIPEAVCVQIMHYHNLISHGGAETAHPHTKLPKEDKL